MAKKFSKKYTSGSKAKHPDNKPIAKNEFIDIPTQESKNESFSKLQKRWIYLAIIVLSFIVYGNTLVNRYALDDAIVITQNQFTKKGFDGIGDILSTELFTGFFGKQKNLVAGGRYRPLSVVTFAIEYELFGENPFISHFLNILFFSLTCIVLFKVLTRIFQNVKSNKWFLSVPVIATLLYVVHPIHTEVVSNIKGRDEIFTLLGSLLTLWYCFRYADTEKISNLLKGIIIFFFTLSSKENSVTFLAIIPITLFFFSSKESVGKTFRTVFISLGGLLLVSAVFFIIRFRILPYVDADIPKELMNDSFLYHTAGEKFGTIAWSMWYYIQLLFFPHPLTYDYYPYQFDKIKATDFLHSVLPFIVNAGLFVFAVFSGLKSLIKYIATGVLKVNIYSYSLLFYFVAFSLVTNIFFPIGTLASERFLFIPSIGFVIIIGYALYRMEFARDVFKKLYAPALILVGIMFLGFSVKTIDRNKDWANDYVLFTADVLVSGNSAKSNTSAGGKMTEEAEKLAKIAEKEYKTAEELIHEIRTGTDLRSYEIEKLIASGNKEEILVQIEKFRMELLKQAIVYLEKAIEIHPSYSDPLLLLGNAYYHYNKDYDTSLKYYKRILAMNPNYDRVFTNVDIIMGTCDSIPQKVAIYDDLYKINPNRFEVNYKLGLLYGENNIDLEKAIFHLEKAYSIKPDNYDVCKALGAGYGVVQNFEKSIEFSEKALKLNPKDEQLKINLGLTYKYYGARIFNVEKDYVKAASLFEKAVSYLPSDIQIYQNLVLTYRQLGDENTAQRWLQKMPQQQG